MEEKGGRVWVYMSQMLGFWEVVGAGLVGKWRSRVLRGLRSE